MNDIRTIDQVRLLIADLSTPQILTDTQLDTFLDLNDGNVRRAAADALEAIARSEVLLSKKIRTQDLNTDGPAVAAELRASATQLRAQADRADDTDDDGLFDIVNTIPDDDRPESTNYTVWGL